MEAVKQKSSRLASTTNRFFGCTSQLPQYIFTEKNEEAEKIVSYPPLTLGHVHKVLLKELNDDIKSLTRQSLQPYEKKTLLNALLLPIRHVEYCLRSVLFIIKSFFLMMFLLIAHGMHRFLAKFFARESNDMLIKTMFFLTHYVRDIFIDNLLNLYFLFLTCASAIAIPFQLLDILFVRGPLTILAGFRNYFSVNAEVVNTVLKKVKQLGDKRDLQSEAIRMNCNRVLYNELPLAVKKMIQTSPLQTVEYLQELLSHYNVCRNVNQSSLNVLPSILSVPVNKSIIKLTEHRGNGEIRFCDWEKSGSLFLGS